MAWEFCHLPWDFGGLGLISICCQGMDLCAKWIIRVLNGNETYKILICHCICHGFPCGLATWKALGLGTLLTMKEPIKIRGVFFL